MTAVVVAVIVTAVYFDFRNGFHDTANAMATSIATGALRPRTAVILAGVLNLFGAFLSVRCPIPDRPGVQRAATRRATAGGGQEADRRRTGHGHGQQRPRGHRDGPDSDGRNGICPDARTDGARLGATDE